jgi:hypothetical protein
VQPWKQNCRLLTLFKTSIIPAFLSSSHESDKVDARDT